MTTSICMPEEQYNQLWVASWLLQKTASDIILDAVRAFLAKWKSQIDRALTAKREVEAGFSLPMPRIRQQKKGNAWRSPSIAVSDDELLRLRVASWLLNRTISDFAREAIETHLQPWREAIQIVIEARNKARRMIDVAADKEKENIIQND